MWRAALLLLSCLLIAGNGKPAAREKRTISRFNWRSCSSNPTNIYRITELNMSPLPVYLPGELSLTMVVDSFVDIPSADVEISMKKKTFFMDLPVPCLLNVGSCTYKDTCTLLDRMERENWGGGMGAPISRQLKTMFTRAGVPNSCPVRASHLEIRNYKIHLPPLPSVLSLFASGDYTLRGRLLHPNGTEIMCFQSAISTAIGPPPAPSQPNGRRG